MNPNETRYDPDSGKLYVPLDLRKDVIEPLAEVRELARTTANGLTHHLVAHDADKAARTEQRDKIIRYAKWGASAAGGIISFALTMHAMGIGI